MKTTKQLARELGLLRKRSINSSTSRKPSTDQTFPYLVVLDFESTCWQDGKFRTQEIIEFPAVLLNTSTGKIESEFQFYVQPQESPNLSEFCKQLTGITQDQVDNGIPLNLCVRKFVRWLDSLKEKKGVVFTQPSTETEKCYLATIVTWSDWDLGVCLYNELRRKQIGRPCQLNSWIDLRATYRKFYSRKPNGLNGALKDLGIDFEGREHSGLHDSRNTAILAYRMIQDGCILNITKTLKGSNIPGGDKYLTIKQPTPNKHKIRQRKQTTPSKSPVHKRRKQTDIADDDELCFDEDLNHALASSQELDNILISVATENPERKRKSRIPLASPCSSKILISEISPIRCSKSPSLQKLTKVKAKRIIPGKFNPSQIYVDPEIDTNAFTNSHNAAGINRLTEVSVNVPLPKRVPTTKKHISPLKITEAYPQIPNLSPMKQSCLRPQNSVIRSNSIRMVRKGTPPKQCNQKPEDSYRNSNNTVRIAVQKFYSSPQKSVEENSSGSETPLPQRTVQSCKLTETPFILPPKSKTDISPRTSTLFPVFKTPSPPSEALITPLVKASCSNTSKTNVKEVTMTPSRTLSEYSDLLKTPVNTQVNCRNQVSLSSLSSSTFKTPSSTLGTFKTLFSGQTNNSVNSSGMKGTPPLCKCGKRSKRRMAQTPGPNMGRFFFCCGASGYNSAGNRNGCGFFKWENPTTINGRSLSFTQNGTLSKPFVPVFSSAQLNLVRKRA